MNPKEKIIEAICTSFLIPSLTAMSLEMIITLSRKRIPATDEIDLRKCVLSLVKEGYLSYNEKDKTYTLIARNKEELGEKQRIRNTLSAPWTPDDLSWILGTGRYAQ